MKTILFVCVENSFRSVLSEATFNSKAPRGWHAESAGVNAGTQVNPVVVKLLSEIGVRLGNKTPMQVSKEQIVRASRVITFGCLDRCPVGAKEKAEDWPVPPSTGKTWEQLQDIRDDLCQRIGMLIQEIESGQI
jgi:arsenate reductase